MIQVALIKKNAKTKKLSQEYKRYCQNIRKKRKFVKVMVWAICHISVDRLACVAKNNGALCKKHSVPHLSCVDAALLERARPFQINRRSCWVYLIYVKWQPCYYWNSWGWRAICSKLTFGDISFILGNTSVSLISLFTRISFWFVFVFSQ